MKTRRLIGGMTCVVGVSVAAPAQAEFLGIQVVNKTTEYLFNLPGTDGLGHSWKDSEIYELYAIFDDPNDTLINVFSAQIQGTHNFVHLPSQGADSSLPWAKQVYDDAQSKMDSYVTIGFSYIGGVGNPDGPDANVLPDPLKAAIDPSFDESKFIGGNQIDDFDSDPAKGAGWYTTEPTANNIQGKAGTYADMKVLLARFSFSGQQGFINGVTGSLRVTYKDGGVTTKQSGFISFEKFDIFGIFPAPQAIALLPLLGLPGRRRRSARGHQNLGCKFPRSARTPRDGFGSQGMVL